MSIVLTSTTRISYPPRSVSYTHLDVYKRQAIFHTVAIGPFCNHTVNKAAVFQIEGISSVIRKNFCDCLNLTAVLGDALYPDVYKRQAYRMGIRVKSTAYGSIVPIDSMTAVTRKGLIPHRYYWIQTT